MMTISLFPRISLRGYLFIHQFVGLSVVSLLNGNQGKSMSINEIGENHEQKSRENVALAYLALLQEHLMTVITDWWSIK